MWSYLSQLFRSSHAITGASARNVIDDKVKQIEAHLDDFSKFPNARVESRPYHLVDWNEHPNKQKTGPIYLGSMLTVTDPEILLPHVGAVLTIIDGRAPEHFVKQKLQDSMSPGTKTHLYLPLDDAPNEKISKYFDPAFQFLRYHQERNIPVLVHCMAGMSRSATLLANYLMKKYKMNALTALDRLKKLRPIVRPNTGFIRQLVEQEQH